MDSGSGSVAGVIVSGWGSTGERQFNGIVPVKILLSGNPESEKDPAMDYFRSRHTFNCGHIHKVYPPGCSHTLRVQVPI